MKWGFDITVKIIFDLFLILGDIGDHVVVINTKDIAMKDDYWRKYKFFHHTRYVTPKQ